LVITNPPCSAVSLR